jgi:hypothetical protein
MCGTCGLEDLVAARRTGWGGGGEIKLNVTEMGREDMNGVEGSRGGFQ